MNKTILILSTLFLSAVSHLGAQSSQNGWLRAQAGYGVCGSGDRFGYLGNLSGGAYFAPRFKAGIGFGYAGFDNGVYTPAEGNQARALSLEANAYYNVLNSEYIKFEVGAGPNVQFWDWQYRADGITTILVDDDIRILPGQRVQFDQTQIGYTVSLGLIVTPVEYIELGFWGVHQNGTNGDNISTLRLGAGFRF
jgi:hypothetical protein